MRLQRAPYQTASIVRVTGLEPIPSVWKTEVLPLNTTHASSRLRVTLPPRATYHVALLASLAGNCGARGYRALLYNLARIDRRLRQCPHGTTARIRTQFASLEARLRPSLGDKTAPRRESNPLSPLRERLRRQSHHEAISGSRGNHPRLAVKKPPARLSSYAPGATCGLAGALVASRTRAPTRAVRLNP